MTEHATAPATLTQSWVHDTMIVIGGATAAALAFVGARKLWQYRRDRRGGAANNRRRSSEDLGAEIAMTGITNPSSSSAVLPHHHPKWHIPGWRRSNSVRVLTCFV